MNGQQDEDGTEKKEADADNIAPPKEGDHPATDADRVAKDNKPKTDWDFRFAVLSLIFDGALMVTAIVGGFFLYDQLRLMRESNALTRQSLQFAKESAADDAE